jgi:hypothetical protein
MGPNEVKEQHAKELNQLGVPKEKLEQLLEGYQVRPPTSLFLNAILGRAEQKDCAFPAGTVDA